MDPDAPGGAHVLMHDGTSHISGPWDQALEASLLRSPPFGLKLCHKIAANIPNISSQNCGMALSVSAQLARMGHSSARSSEVLCLSLENAESGEMVATCSTLIGPHQLPCCLLGHHHQTHYSVVFATKHLLLKPS